MEKLAKRKQNRLQNFDYSTNGAYFITICTQGKKCILSKIVGGDALIAPKITLTKYGQIAEKYIKNIPGIIKYIIMPNHIHLLIVIDGSMKASTPTVSSLIRSFKGLTVKEIGKPIFQRSFYDHIIRNEEDYLNVWEYINSNANKWKSDKYYTK